MKSNCECSLLCFENNQLNYFQRVIGLKMTIIFMIIAGVCTDGKRYFVEKFPR